VVPADRRTLTYALTVENRTPSSGGVAAANVILRESLGGGATYQAAQPNGNFTCNAGGSSLTCNLGQMAAGSQAQVILTVAVANDVAIGAEIAAESSVESNTPDAIPDNNQLLTRIALLPQADFYVTSLGEGGDLNPGDGICESRNGCTLRAAIQEANARPGPQTIAWVTAYISSTSKKRSDGYGCPPKRSSSATT
jgi:CSLREA domain-containing protein